MTPKYKKNVRRNPESALQLHLKKYRGAALEIDLSPYRPLVEAIRSLSGAARGGEPAATPPQKHDTDGIPVSSPESIDDSETLRLFAESVRAARSTLHMDPYDEQLIAAIVMFEGKLAQMKTGEGKTLAAAISASCSARAGRRVHILTANEYLARRDADWMGPMYRLLGLRVASVHERMTADEKREAYGAHIVYCTAKQAGFDFLHDHMQYDPGLRVQPPYSTCIVDEADFIMIDEARIPLVVAKESSISRASPESADRIAAGLEPLVDFEVDRQGRICALTIDGQYKVQRAYGCGGMHDLESAPYYAAVNVALHARNLLERDVDYIVRNDRIELVDEFTGRIAEKRKWPYGIQSALEAKEHLKTEDEGSICASITVQHFIEQYPIVLAMTATAVSAVEEFGSFYHLTTVVIPPHRTDRMQRLDDRVFTTIEEKTKALIDEIETVHDTGRPILIGTRTVRESRELSRRLSERGISHSVLNAENDEEEAPIIAGAGILGSVTISTNMAGRGTDIKLGGPDEAGHAEVAATGGLYVIGTNRHESVRIDNQLLGRAARQGDPGSGRFFISLEDPLIVNYAILDFIPEDRHTEGEEIIDRRVNREIDRAQEIIEGQHFQMRRTLRRYTEIVDRQRTVVYGLRADALEKLFLPETLIAQCREAFETADSQSTAYDPEKLLALLFVHELDEFWIDHLAWIDGAREGIYLRRLGKRDPFLDFLTDATEAFDRGLAATEDRTSSRFGDLVNDPDALASIVGELLRPASTWTYMINDNPFPSFRIAVLGISPGTDAAGAAVAAVAAPFVVVYAVLRWISRLFRRSPRNHGTE